MEKLGYIILVFAAIAWLVVMVLDMVPVYPEGTIGLVSLLGVGILLAKVFKDRVVAARTDKYSKHVKR
ncbi:MAG TPA: hypothetical protein ENI11_06535 [Actinobacteria bacterium]|nr:hypothetical protein [Actinomycetota bacterium]